jgi:hypothetical protein
MSDKSAKLVELREALSRREDALKIADNSYDRRVIESHIMELKQDIAALEKQDGPVFSSGPAGGAR